MPASATGGVSLSSLLVAFSANPSQGNGQIPTSAIGNYSAFPPGTMLMTDVSATATITLNADQMALLPTFTATGTPVTLTHAAVPTNIDPGSGWFNAQDTAGAYTTVKGCTYPE